MQVSQLQCRRSLLSPKKRRTYCANEYKLRVPQQCMCACLLACPAKFDTFGSQLGYSILYSTHLLATSLPPDRQFLSGAKVVSSDPSLPLIQPAHTPLS